MKASKTLFFALFTLGLVVACFVVAAGSASTEALPVASASSSNGEDDGDDDDDDGGGGDLASGMGVTFGGVVAFDFLATSGPLGQNPSGTFSFTQIPFVFGTFSGEVTCLAVSGNTATFGGEVTQSDLSTPEEGDRIKFTVQDNGPDGSLDLISIPAGQAGPSDCTPLVPTQTLQSGDIVVQDNTAGGGGGDDDDDDDEDDDDD